MEPTKQQTEVAEKLKKQGYYILVSTDKQRKISGFQVVKNIRKDTKRIACELNRSGYEFAKKHFSFKEVIQDVWFSKESLPFAYTNKEKQPLQIGFKID